MLVIMLPAILHKVVKKGNSLWDIRAETLKKVRE